MTFSRSMTPKSRASRASSRGDGEALLRLAVFEADATPPLGHPLCGGSVPPARRIVDRLSARGLVLIPPANAPVALCAVDWVNVSNASHDRWREALAAAAGTRADRVSVHCTHPHDAPYADLSVQRLLDEAGLPKAIFDPEFEARVIAEVAQAIARARATARPVTHLSLGKAKVSRFASTRRLLGPEGKVAAVRFSSCRDPVLRAREEGTIDPDVRVVGFWSDSVPVAVVSYYASHPQSFYKTGGVSSDTVGLARSLRDLALPDAVHIHFCGAAGNVAAGKYNDGSPRQRLRLAERLAGGMERAWARAIKRPLRAAEFDWQTREIVLPMADGLADREALQTTLRDAAAPLHARRAAAHKLIFAERCRQGRPWTIGCLRLGSARILHGPGEWFVEYQLAAQALRPRGFVALAAYGDGGPGYLGTREAYAQGGYECDPSHTKVSPAVEAVLMRAMEDLLIERPTREKPRPPAPATPFDETPETAQ